MDESLKQIPDGAESNSSNVELNTSTSSSTNDPQESKTSPTKSGTPGRKFKFNYDENLMSGRNLTRRLFFVMFVFYILHRHFIKI